MKEFEIREYPEDEYKADMRKLIADKGLKQAVKKYLDMIVEETADLPYIPNMSIKEWACDILTLCELEEERTVSQGVFDQIRWERDVAVDQLKQLGYSLGEKIRPEWILVSEKLPESAGVYIVTREFNDGFECADLTDACYFDGTSTWYDDNRINHSREYVDKKIKAWMPLPKPYREDDETE